MSSFSDFEKQKFAGHFIREPSTFPVEKIKALAETFGLPRQSLEDELMDVQARGNTHTVQQASSGVEMWITVPGQILRLLNAKVLSIFG